jgi:hypothetical protein
MRQGPAPSSGLEFRKHQPEQSFDWENVQELYGSGRTLTHVDAEPITPAIPLVLYNQESEQYYQPNQTTGNLQNRRLVVPAI